MHRSLKNSLHHRIFFSKDQQMWKLDGKTLKNKAGLWTSDANWNLPIEGKPGSIEKTSMNHRNGFSALNTDFCVPTFHNDIH